MKTLSVTLFCLLSILFSCSVHKEIRGNEIIKSKEISIGDYSKIEVSHTANLVYEQKANASPYLRVEIDENLEEYLILEVKGSTLIVSSNEDINTNNYKVYTNSKELVEVKTSGISKVSLNGDISTDNNFKIYCSGASKLGIANILVKGTLSVSGHGVSSLNIEYLQADDIICDMSGSSNLTFSGIAKKLDVGCSGASKLDANQLQVDDMVCDVSGGSNLTLSGVAKKLDVDCSGASKLDANQLQVDDMVCDLSGASSAVVFAKNKLEASVSGASTLKYKEVPQMQNKISTSGTSSVKPY